MCDGPSRSATSVKSVRASLLRAARDVARTLFGAMPACTTHLRGAEASGSRLARFLVAALGGVLLDGFTGRAAAAAQPEIASIVLLSAPDQQLPADTAPAGVDLSRVQAPSGDRLAARLNELLGQPIDRSSLDRMRATISDHYREEGRPFLDVGIPRQDVTEGVVQFIVTEFRVGDVRVEGNDWFSSRFIANRAGLETGSIIDRPALDRRIALLSAGQYLSVVPEFSPGATRGTTDMVLRATDRIPLQLTAGFNNTGSAVTGWERWTLGASWGDGFRAGHTLDWNVSASSDFWRAFPVHEGHRDPSSMSHTFGWRIPLASRDAIKLTASHARKNPQHSGGLSSPGLNLGFSAFYEMQLPPVSLAIFRGARQDLSIGYEFKRSNNNLSFGGTTVQSGFSEVSQFALRYTITSGGADGLTTLQIATYLSPGGMMAGNTDSAFQPSGTEQSGMPGARARYAYNRTALSRQIPLSESLELFLRASGQAATGTLLGSEQLSIAGSDSVRGYREFARAGSLGVALGSELRGPPITLLSRLVPSLPEDVLKPHLFLDAGHGWNPIASSSAPARQRTASFGIGAQYNLGRSLNLRLEQGWQLLRDQSRGANGAFLHAAITATW